MTKNVLVKEFEIMWSDLDPNRHMRHTAYNDYAAHMRVKMLEDVGLNMASLTKMRLGPILFREETLYHREVGMEGNIKITAAVLKAREDGSRWSFIHEIYRADGIKAATVIADGAWIDLDKRKLGVPSAEVTEKFLGMPRAANFEWV